MQELQQPQLDGKTLQLVLQQLQQKQQQQLQEARAAPWQLQLQLQEQQQQQQQQQHQEQHTHMQQQRSRLANWLQQQEVPSLTAILSLQLGLLLQQLQQQSLSCCSNREALRLLLRGGMDLLSKTQAFPR